MAKSTEVTDALAFFVSLLPGASVDNDGYITREESGERINVGDPSRPMILYQERLGDHNAHLFNPFTESQNEPPAARWFYTAVVDGAFLSRLYVILHYLIECAAKQKATAKAEDLPPLPLPITTLLATALPGGGGPVGDSFDAQSVKELQMFRDDTADPFARINYIRRQLQARPYVALLDANSVAEKHKAHKGLRKKTVAALQTLTRALLHLGPNDDPAMVYSTDLAEGAPAKMSATLGCLFKLLHRLNPVIEHINQDWVVDLGTFQGHLDRLPEYKGVAQLAIPTTPGQKPTSTIPGTTSAMIPGPGGVAMTIGGAPAASQPQAGTMRVPGPMGPDGRPTVITQAVQPQSNMGFAPTLQYGMGFGMGGIGGVGGVPPLAVAQSPMGYGAAPAWGMGGRMPVPGMGMGMAVPPLSMPTGFTGGAVPGMPSFGFSR